MTGSVVDTATGRVRGVVTSRALMFKGIPFAAPPVGHRRWRAPEPVEPWAGVYSADEFGPICLQRTGPIEEATGLLDAPMGEDCLYLNVWTPAADEGKRPVMVWVHGGGFIGGGGSAPFYDGRRLAQRGDVVVVTFNYRLGAFGFLHLADLGGEGWVSAGNCGLLDQLAALRWVHENIAAFGGDPGNVTVFGESAGAFSIADLLAVPVAGGLFRRAILQSGNPVAVHNRDSASAVAATVLDALGIGPHQLADLYDVPGEPIMRAQEKAAKVHSHRALPFAPVVDQILLPTHPQDAADAGHTHPVAIITGTNRDEMRLFVGLDPKSYAFGYEDLEARIAALPGVGRERAHDLAEAYREREPAAPPGMVLAAVQTDWAFRIPAIRHAEAHTAAGRLAWMYWFTFPTPAYGGMFGSCHGLEIPFVFDVVDRPGVEVFTGSDPARQRLADAMATAWLSFAQTGDPGWPAYEPDGDRTTRRFDLDSGLVDDPDGGLRELWKDVVRR